MLEYCLNKFAYFLESWVFILNWVLIMFLWTTMHEFMHCRYVHASQLILESEALHPMKWPSLSRSLNIIQYIRYVMHGRLHLFSDPPGSLYNLRMCLLYEWM